MLSKFFSKKTKLFNNIEGFLNFDYELTDSAKPLGYSAMLRVKNEETKIKFCLESVIDVFDEIVFVDNNSTDKTLEIVRKFQTEHKQGSKIKVFFYPFNVAKCGKEHNDTAEDSVHNLAYFYNWSVSKCSYNHIVKWDADMIIAKHNKELLMEYLEDFKQQKDYFSTLTGNTVYKTSDAKFYRALDEFYGEPRIFPNRASKRFLKAENFEKMPWDDNMTKRLSELAFYELKFVDEAEYSHWSTLDFPSDRKKKEWKNFSLVKSGQIDETNFEKLPDDILEV